MGRYLRSIAQSSVAVEGPRVDAIVSQLPVTSAIDVGTGTGQHALNLARRGFDVTTIDQSPEMLSIAREAAQREGLDINFQLGDIETGVPFESDQFDLLICALTLCHIADLGKVTREF